MSAFSNSSFPPPDLSGRNHFWELGMIRMHYTVLIFLEVNGLSRAIKRGIESKRALPFRIARAHLWWIERSNHWQQLFQSNLFCPLYLLKSSWCQISIGALLQINAISLWNQIETRQNCLQSNSGPMCAFVFVCWHCGEAMQTGHPLIIKLQCSVVNSAGPL